MKITSSNPAYIPQVQSRPATNSSLNAAFRPAVADGFDGVAAQKAAPAPDIFAGRNDPPVFTGFDNSKLAAPLVMQADGQPKSAKYTFAKLAQDSGAMPRTKAEAEQWFNSKIKPGMEAAGFQVDQVKGDSAFIHTRENPEGEWVDFLRGAGSNDKSYQALAWQSNGPGNAPAAGASGASAAGGASAMLQQLMQMLQKLMDPNLTDEQKMQGLQQILGALQGQLSGANAAGGAAATGTPSVGDKPFSQVPGFDFGKLQDPTHVNDKYTPAVRTFSQAIGGLPPVSESLPAIVDYAKSHGFPNAKVAGKDLLDFGDGHGAVDVITDVGGPKANWWFNNQPQG